MIEPTMRPLPQVLEELRSRTFERGILSVYLDTSPGRVMGKAFLVAFHDACVHFRAKINFANAEDCRRFEAATATVKDFLAAPPHLDSPGLAIFVAVDDSTFMVTQFPQRTEDHVLWGIEPSLDLLEEALDEFERFAVLLFDKEHSRLFAIFLGKIEKKYDFKDYVQGKQATGGWYGLSQKRYERHHDAQVLRHAKRTIRTAMDLLRDKPFDRLLIGGPDEAVSLLIDRLPKPLRNRLAGTIRVELFARDAEVLAAALVAIEVEERTQELSEVESLIEHVSTPHVVMGLEPVLSALNEGRVHRLFLANDLAVNGYRCEICGRLTARSERCPSCGGTIKPINDLREHAVELAVAQGARLEFVEGIASELLIARGGLGARTRH